MQFSATTRAFPEDAIRDTAELSATTDAARADQRFVPSVLQFMRNTAPGSFRIAAIHVANAARHAVGRLAVLAVPVRLLAAIPAATVAALAGRGIADR